MKTFGETFDVAFRIAALAVSVVLCGMVLILCAKDAGAATLRSVSIVSGDALTLGDVFDGLGKEEAAYVLGTSPKPGHDLVLDASTLMRVAMALNLPWRPRTAAEQVVVRRAATVVNAETITAALSSALTLAGLDGKFNILYNGDTPEIILPQMEVAGVEVTDMHFEPRKDAFEATLASPSKAHPIAKITLTGTIQRLSSVPVVRNTLQNGTTITADDVDWIDIPVREIQNGYVLKAETLIGMTPRRMLLAGKPVQATEVAYPKLVNRSDTVTIVYNEGQLFLTTKGRALEGGAKGDIIRVVNMGSSHTIDATVTGDHEVTVSDKIAANTQTATQ